ncbi:hypothetical protein ACDQ55_09480 [Chitinophaga sp. 30R24]|uniref:hypothetical protein n=1 Tax=Chitinophaga sp. 30R24 TaxID=3248838 RepID=UPI003B8F39D0
MKNILLSLLFLLGTTQTFAQLNLDLITDSIAQEGERLYRSELAAWYGTDIFLERFKTLKEQSGGYLSYPNHGLYNCIFFSKGEAPKVLVTISFDSTYNLEQAIIFGEERNFTEEEKMLYSIRKEALEEANKQDSFVRFYEHCNLNLIPLVYRGQKKVYILTGTSIEGIVLFGNDYLFTYGEDNQLLEKKRIHQNLIPVQLPSKDSSQQKVIAAFHNHLQASGDFISATDICTLLLYERVTDWQQYYVISEKYVSIWDCKKHLLTALTREAWDKIHNEETGTKQ